MLNKRGFTLIELIIVMSLVAIVFGWLFVGGVVIKGNQWFTEVGVLRELLVGHPEVKEILDTKRNVYGYSVIRVKNSDNSISTYLLDTDILFNYEFRLQKTNR